MTITNEKQDAQHKLMRFSIRKTLANEADLSPETARTIEDQIVLDYVTISNLSKEVAVNSAKFIAEDLQ